MPEERRGGGRTKGKKGKDRNIPGVRAVVDPPTDLSLLPKLDWTANL